MLPFDPHEALQSLPAEPFLREEALRAGVPKSWLRQLQQAELLRQPLRGVLVPQTCPDDVELRAKAARLVLPERAALCRVTAAWLLGIDARAPGAHQELPPTDCAVPRGTTPVRRPGLRCYVTDLRQDDVVDVAGALCTTPARTAIDLARWSVPGTGLGVLDRMARLGLVEPSDLADRIERWQGAPFVAQARRLIGWCNPLAESFGESCLRLRFHDAGFPAPELQISLADENGTERYRLDLGYRKHRFAWEYDGEEHHQGRAAEQHDRLRRAAIERTWGWGVVGVTKNLVLGPSMDIERSVGEILGLEPAIRRRLW